MQVGAVSMAAPMPYVYNTNRVDRASLNKIEPIEDDVLAFFHTGTSEMHRTKIPGLSLFMRDCIPLSPVEFRRIDSLLPITHTFRKTIQYLKSDESKAIQSVLEDMDNDLSLKQRAIGTIFFYNGMRSSDVANLKLDSVDLKRQLISFTQVKTGVPTTLPLLPVVGNAIYDLNIRELIDNLENHG